MYFMCSQKSSSRNIFHVNVSWKRHFMHFGNFVLKIAFQKFCFENFVPVIPENLLPEACKICNSEVTLSNDHFENLRGA